MNKLQRYKCNHCDAVFSHRQSKFKHELNCKKRTSTPNLSVIAVKNNFQEKMCY